MKWNRWLTMAGVAAAMLLGVFQSLAQDRPPGRPDFGDPEARQRWMMDRVKEQLEISDDTEWKAIQPLVQKVMDARMATFSGMGRMFGRRGGDRGGDNNDSRRSFGPPPTPETQALEKAVDGKASNAELKAALAKFVEARKAKQAELEKAQADLRKVLSVRQEAIATLNGWL